MPKTGKVCDTLGNKNITAEIIEKIIRKIIFKGFNLMSECMNQYPQSIPKGKVWYRH